jgi:hypothetical protein
MTPKSVATFCTTLSSISFATLVFGAPIAFIPGPVSHLEADILRNRLLIGYGGAISSFDLTTGTLLQSNIFTGVGREFDISPDGTRLAAANNNHSPKEGTQWLSVHNLETGSYKDYEVPVFYAEDEFWSLVFADDNSLLLSTESNIRRLNLLDGATGLVDVPIFGYVNSAGLRPSPDRSVIAATDSSTSGGFYYFYDVASSTMRYGGTTNSYGPTVTINRSSSRFAVPIYGKLEIFDFASLDNVGNLSRISEERGPADVLYSPVNDILYVVWGGRLGAHGLPHEIAAYNAKTLKLIETLSVETEGWIPNLDISTDGHYLYAINNSPFNPFETGVSIFDVSGLVVPEPASLALAATAFIAYRRRARRIMR